MSCWADDDDLVRLGVAAFEARCRDKGVLVDAAGGVAEGVAAWLLGWAHATLASRRGSSWDAPPYIPAGGFGYQTRYRLEDLASWVVSHRRGDFPTWEHAMRSDEFEACAVDCEARLLSRCREMGAQVWISADGRVGEPVAAALLGLSPATLANRRGDGTGPPYYKLAGGHQGVTFRVTYSLRDLARWIVAHRAT